ncbi:efflux RND transporter periplasmic adaptor subunit [Undibacterium oligocarboniphilum]|uniref:Efflux RND transporter periplasmic adaptor subunit n=1 Tax=Undibacterium oligocarboniphilum TaxID=666702 RepID=A0A850QLN1_9BURK|nr:efflux RND transporter periplasmic adaptor subunit [Undibacterium oligocarboniphilum]MBC3869691.1 efflux RND transporter periplasmic adaptor subunit [Undibacterium oligocarboniphilum]NVO77294.1 efflux RND transporter periplasmic adaptor subunit [Undibacterium oligocarboniphilum]
MTRTAIRLAALTFAGTLLSHLPLAQAAGLVVEPVRSSQEGQRYQADGVVEAVRQSVISAQISGAIVQLPVKAGDAVKAGQVLVRIDARAANQEASASRAQVDAARAALQVASKDFERQKQLFTKNYISQAQLDRAESQYQSASAQANAQLAQAAAVQTQSGFYTLTAPYSGLLSDVPITMGDMAMPGRPLMTVYDPSAMRVSVTVPQEKAAQLATGQTVRVAVTGLPEAQRWISATKVTVLPAADAATHTVQVRLDLPASLPGLTPGMFARASLPVNAPLNTREAARLFVPAKAVFRRAELYAVYVVNAQGKPLLRQVRPGAVNGGEQEILSGVVAGEQVATDPLAAAAVSAGK